MRTEAEMEDRVSEASSRTVPKVPAFPIVLICAGFLVVPAPLRELLFGEVAKAVNFVSWTGLFLSVLSVKPRIDFLRFKVVPIFIAILLAAFLAMGTTSARQSFIVLDIVAYVLPVLIVLYAGEKSLHQAALCLLPFWAWFLNVAVMLIAVGGVIDLFFNHAASVFFTELYGARSYIGLLSEERMVSFYGHALAAASFVMVAFVSNFLLSIVRGTRVSGVLLVLYIGAMGLTTSKSGIVILLAAIVVTSLGAGRWRSIFLTFVGAAAAYFAGVFDAVLVRFTEGFESGDITTGRNESLDVLLASGELAFHFFTGQVLDTTDTSMIAALEYPLLRFAFRNGIVFALLFSIAYFVVPLVKMLAKGRRAPLLGWVALAVSVNTYSGIAAYGDLLLMFSITTMLALVVSRENSEPVAVQ